MTSLQIVRQDMPIPDGPAPLSYVLSDQDREVLNRLRWVARRCRSAARVDLFEACAILSTDRDVADTAHAEVLMKSLSQVLGKAPVFYRPGVGEVSFEALIPQTRYSNRQMRLIENANVPAGLIGISLWWRRKSPA